MAIDKAIELLATWKCMWCKGVHPWWHSALWHYFKHLIKGVRR